MTPPPTLEYRCPEGEWQTLEFATLDCDGRAPLVVPWAPGDGSGEYPLFFLKALARSLPPATLRPEWRLRLPAPGEPDLVVAPPEDCWKLDGRKVQGRTGYHCREPDFLNREFVDWLGRQDDVPARKGHDDALFAVWLKRLWSVPGYGEWSGAVPTDTRGDPR